MVSVEAEHGRNDQGTPESVAYETLPSLLLNEYQKQGRELAVVKAELAATAP